MRRWPDTLPTPSHPGFGLTPAEQVLRTDMEVGFARVRRLTFARQDHVEMQWTFTDAEMAAFRGWYEDAAWSLAGDSDSLLGWGVNAASLVADTTVGPDLVLADRLVDTVALDEHYAQKVLAPEPVDGTMVIGCASLHMAGRKWARLGLVDRAGALCWTNVNVETGEFGGMGGLVSRTIKDRGDGWWRVSITAMSGTGAANPKLRLALLDATPAAYYAGDGLSGVDVCEVYARVVTGYDLFVRSDAYASAPVAQVIYHTLELWHPAFTVPIRVVRDYAPIDARLEAGAARDPGEVVTFTAYAFDVVPPDQTTTGLPQCVIEIDNVSREILMQIDAAVMAEDPITVIYRAFLSDSLDTGPETDPPLAMTLITVSATPLRIRAVAGFANLLDAKFPKLDYDLATFPGLQP